jgi:hypothetical protein
VEGGKNVWKGKVRHMIWLSIEDTLKYNEIAKKKGTAPNRIQSAILQKALADICENCSMPRLICSCETVQCKYCQKQFIKHKGYEERYCSQECAVVWWNDLKAK